MNTDLNGCSTLTKTMIIKLSKVIFLTNLSVRNLIALLLVGLMTGCVAAPGYKGSAKENFDGAVFTNREPMHKSITDILKLGWSLMTQSADWPANITVTRQEVPKARVETGISVSYINHSTVLIQAGNVNILTDPIYAERASPFRFAGPKRVHQPGIRLEDLPPIDIILISHNHYDHLDTDSLTRLVNQQSYAPRILTGLGNSALLDKIGLVNHRELNWNDSEQFKGTKITFTESRHRSGRGLTDQMQTLWGSFVIETTSGNVYFAGDTGYDKHFKAAKEKFGAFALSIIPIGAYEPRWFMKDVHLNPAEAVQAHLDLNSELSLAVHFGTFQLTLEAIEQPVIDLAKALKANHLDEQHFITLKPGATHVVRPEN